ncbi:MAG: efflux RND transporter periplasmic adaptor subunit [Marinifilaceae bacterium]
MIKKISYIVLGLFVASCGTSDNKGKQLSDLKKQRDELSQQIVKLTSELRKENGSQVEHSSMVDIKQYSGVEFKHYIDVQGLIESDNNILIPAQSPGLVRRIFVKEGDKVHKGKVLAQIDSDLILRGIKELKISLELATTVCERQTRLWNKKIGSEIQYLQAKTQKESLEMKLQSLNKQLEMSRIIAPISGTIDHILIKEGEMAAAGKGAIRIVNVSDLKITASLSEIYINDIKKGDDVAITIPSLNKLVNDKVISVAKVIDPKNRTFNIEIAAPELKNIKPNMLTVLRVNDYTKADAILVPMNILQNTGKKFFVFKAVQKDGKWHAKKAFVKPGKYYNNQIELLEGVDEGDYLVTFGFQQISDGSLLTISK